MIKTRYGSIVSNKFNSEYICYDSSIQPILKDRILSSLATDDYRLTNNSNFLDLNNGLIKKHFCRKGLMYIFSDNYIYNGLKKTRPVRELTNYIDFNHLIKTSNNDWIINKIEPCFPVFAYIKRNYLFYKGDIILSKILGKTLDKYLSENNRLNIEEQLGFCFGFLFERGIYNFDMNLKNIIFNEDTNKLSFIDFDKLWIKPSLRKSSKYSLKVINKFESSLEKNNLKSSFRWSQFINSLSQ